jgi:glutaredoxin-like protein NrdH
MNDALEKIDYNTVPGDNKEHKLRLYALSTCAFCKKAMTYLEEKGYEFQYIYLDQIDFDLKRAAKQELKSTYDNIPVFPILTIDDSDAMSGFIEPKWTERLGVE